MAKIIIKKQKREYIEELKCEKIVAKAESYYVGNTDREFQTTYGAIPAESLKKDGVVTTKQGKEYSVFEADWLDEYRRIKRLPQIIPLKDVGNIIVNTGLTKDSLVLDSGTGSGALALYLAHIVRQVVTYELEEKHYLIAQENAKDLGITNVTFKHKDATKGFDETGADLITLDLPTPWEMIDHCTKALRLGGYVVSYSPTITQAADFANAMAKSPHFIIIKSCEVMEREWEIDGRKVRPVSEIMHSGFLTYCRRIQ